MNGPMDIIQLTLEAESTLTNMIEWTDGFPNIAQEVAPDDMVRPYIVLRLESDTPEGNDLLDDALISVDVYVEGDREKSRTIAKVVERILHNRRYEPYTGGIVSFRKFRHEPPQPDPSVKCVNVKIMLRYERNDLL